MVIGHVYNVPEGLNAEKSPIIRCERILDLSLEPNRETIWILECIEFAKELADALKAQNEQVTG